MSKMASTIAAAALVLLTAFAGLVHSLASTDTITWGGDNTRAGYQTNHNMDPSVVGSDQFAQLFKVLLPGNYNGASEQIFSQPLVYTPSDGVQYVYFATTQNNVYKLNAKTGAIVASRNLHIPFLTADLDGCVDINPLVGITSTGVIDPDTDTLYLTAKTYANQNGGNGAQGKPNGRYYLHALNVNDLSERPNFPVNLEGTVARNNPSRSFNGGIHHQRPALLHSGQFIYAGFASHCVQYNFTGWIMGWDKTTGANVERWATEGAGVPNTTPGGGVWMSGGGLASDDAGSMFFATGNGYASQLATVPVSGRDPPTSLEEAAVHMTINGDGSLTIVDFFMPQEKQALDGADKDLGTSPLEILPSTFSCGDVRRIGVVTGKSGKTYWLNLDNLGGYRNGPNSGDAVIQVYQNENSVYAGAGVYPLEGGYIYINVINYPSHVFKFSCTNGVPSFTKVADSPTNNAGILGVGHGTVTSLGQPGTGLVWTSDVQGASLRIYNAIPNGGLLTLVKSFTVPGVTKFTRPVFGDGIVYQGTTQGYVYAFGAPTNPPLQCTGPVAFGTSEIGVATAETTVTCTAKVAVTVNSFALNSTDFGLDALPTVPLAVAAGASFTFKAYFRPTKVGLLSTSVIIGTTNNVAGYSVNTPVRLSGTGSSASALLDISPLTLTFQEIITGAAAGGVNQTVLFSNEGNSVLTISGIKYSQAGASGPFITPETTAAGPKVGPFTFEDLPASIAANSDATVTVNFNPTTSGNYTVYAVVNSNGGSKTLVVTASSGQAPVALLQFQTPDGSSWVTYVPGQNFTFGNVTENTTRYLKLRLTNGGGAGATELSVTVSKPPFGVSGIIRANNQVDLGEGTTLGPGESQTATLFCSVPKEQWNVEPYSGNAQWTMNTNDPNWGKQFIQFSCLAVSEQAPPLLANGLGRYRYVGCFKENNPGRQLPTQLYSNDANTNAMCIAACANGNYAYCGTEYNKECFAGPNIPTLQVDDANCNYPCAGDLNQVCGGNGVGANAGGAYLSVFRDTLNGGGGTTTTPGISVNPGIDGYASIGCYTEATGKRALVNGVAVTTKTVASCIKACESTYTLVGLEYGGECWCANAFSAGSVSTSIGDCNMPCADNSSEYCGAGSRLNVYQFNATALSSSTSTSSTSTRSTSTTSSSTVVSTTTVSTSTVSSTTVSTSASSTPTGPAIKQTVGTSWQFQGCWTEATSTRALSSKTYADDAMTLESCSTFCADYTYFGVEYGRECYCGNTLNAGSVKAANQNDCSFLCPGDPSEYCGAGNRLELYLKAAASSTSSVSTSASTTSTTSRSSSSSISSSTTSATTSSSTSAVPTLSHRAKMGAYNLVGCWTEGQGTRALKGATFAYDGMTLESCMANCAGFVYFGAEYGRECYCGNTLDSTSTSAPLADCKMVCGGDSTEYCGAGNRLELYSSAAQTSSTSATSTSTSRTSTSSASSSSSSSTSTISTTTASSSVVSSSSTSSTRSSTSTTSTSSTSSTLATSTTSSVSSSSSTSTSSTSSTRSSTTSSGTSSSSTSTPASSSTSSSTTSATPSVYTGPPVTVPGNVNFTYYHCVSEPSSGRLLKNKVSNLANATVESCLSQCYMYTFVGLEYSGECWCDNSINWAGNAGATPGGNVTESQCNKPCRGNSSEFCGGSLRLNLYQKRASLPV